MSKKEDRDIQLPEHLECWPNEYSNFDHKHPGEEAEAALRAGTHYVEHPAYDHYGVIWFDGEQFIERTKAYHVVVGVYKGDSMKDVFEQANEEHGWK